MPSLRSLITWATAPAVPALRYEPGTSSRPRTSTDLIAWQCARGTVLAALDSCRPAQRVWLLLAYGAEPAWEDYDTVLRTLGSRMPRRIDEHIDPVVEAALYDMLARARGRPHLSDEALGLMWGIAPEVWHRRHHAEYECLRDEIDALDRAGLGQVARRLRELRSPSVRVGASTRRADALAGSLGGLARDDAGVDKLLGEHGERFPVDDLDLDQAISNASRPQTWYAHTHG